MKNRILPHMGWPLLCILIGTPILIWATMLPLEERFSSSYSTLTNIGRLSGIVAAVLFCLNIVLTSRLKALETIFGGLNKMYIAHHIIDGLALCILLIHPLVFSLRATTISAHDAAMQLLPFATDTATTIGIFTLWLFIVLMVLTFYIKLPYKTWLLTHKFLGLVLIGIILHIFLGSNDVAESAALRAYCWAILGLAAAAFIYKTLLPKYFIKHYAYQITEVTMPSKGVVRISMIPKNKTVPFISGQFVFVSFRAEGFSREWHPFTVSSNAHSPSLAITVKALGKYTGTLSKLAPGMNGMDVWVEGAYGKFSYTNFKRSHQIWVAGGIGITPFLSMLPDVLSEYSVDLYYSVKSEAELIDWQFLADVTQKSPATIRLIPIITDRDGFLSANKIVELSGDLSDADILLCGPPPMMYALKGQLKAVGVKKRQIHSEEFAMS